MAFHVIYGRSKTGKTTKVFERIKTDINNNKKAILIVPEQYSFTAEKNVINILGNQFGNLVETLSFKRFCSLLVKEYGDFTKQFPAKNLKSLIVYKLLLDNLPELKTVKTKKNARNLSDEFLNLFSEFKRYMVTPQMVSDICEKASGGLYVKLFDLQLIYQKYQEKISASFTDDEELILVATKIIKEKHLFSDTNIYIDEFHSFTGQEMFIIETLMKTAENFTVALCTDELSGYDRGDLFYPVYHTYLNLVKIAENNKIELSTMKMEQNYYRSAEIAHLESEIFNYPPKIYCEKVQNVKIFKGSNSYKEVEYVVFDIIKAVKEKGLRYKDFAILYADESYLSVIEDVFVKNNVPIYFDQKIPVISHCLYHYLATLLECVIYDFNKNALINHLKSEFYFWEDIDKISLFENFIIENPVKPYIIKNSEKFYRMARNILEDNETALSAVCEVYEKAVLPILNLKFSVCKTTAEISDTIIEFLKSSQISEKLEKIALKLKSDGVLSEALIYAQVFEIILNSLIEFKTYVEDSPIELDEYFLIFKELLAQYELKTTPLSLDTVICSHFQRLRADSIKGCFIVGFNASSIPSASKKEGFLHDSEREKMKNLGVELSPSSEYNSNLEIFYIYKALTIGNEFLTLTYSSSNCENEKLKPSYILEQISKILNSIEEIDEEKLSFDHFYLTKDALFSNIVLKYAQATGSENIQNIKAVFSKFLQDEEYQALSNTVLKFITRELPNQNIKVSRAVIEKVIGKNIKCGVSRLETYRKCKFSYFLKYLLKINKRQEFNFSFIDAGVFLHNVLEKFATKMEQDAVSFEKLQDQYIDKNLPLLVDQVLKSNLDELKKNEFAHIYKKLLRIASRVVKIIREHFTKGLFTPLGYEIEFGFENSEIEGYKIRLSDDSLLELTGKIDRVDSLTTDSGTYIRVVDYKSSDTSLELSEVYYGIRLQLLLYLQLLLKNANGYKGLSNLKPGGVFYLKLDDPLIPLDGPVSDEELLKKRLRALMMRGFILNEFDVISSMDKEFSELSSYTSDVVDVRMNKDGVLSSKNAYSLSEFELLLKQTTNTLKELAESIKDGDFSIKPILASGKSPCSYCEYSAVCGFDEAIFKEEKIPKISKEDVLIRLTEVNGSGS